MRTRGFCAFLLAQLAAGLAAAAQPLQLEGRYEWRNDPVRMDLLGDLVCFYPAPRSAALLPRGPADQRTLCLRNSVEAKRLLGIARPPAGTCGWKGQATIRIDAFRFAAGDGDYFDTALLRAVPHRGTPQRIPCD